MGPGISAEVDVPSISPAVVEPEMGPFGIADKPACTEPICEPISNVESGRSSEATIVV